jgi:hypothetical protein
VGDTFIYSFVIIATFFYETVNFPMFENETWCSTRAASLTIAINDFLKIKMCIKWEQYTLFEVMVGRHSLPLPIGRGVPDHL